MDNVVVTLPLAERRCCWCSSHMGWVPCLPEQAGSITHGLCDPCMEREKATLNGAVAGPAESLPGSQRTQDNGAAGSAGAMRQPQADEYAGARPAAPFTRPLFWTVTGRDFGRAIAWARRQPNAIAQQIRRRLQS